MLGGSDERTNAVELYPCGMSAICRFLVMAFLAVLGDEDELLGIDRGV